MTKFLDLRKKVEPQVKIVYKTIIQPRLWYVELVKVLVVIVITGTVVWGVSKADITQEIETISEDNLSAAVIDTTPDSDTTSNSDITSNSDTDSSTPDTTTITPDISTDSSTLDTTTTPDISTTTPDIISTSTSTTPDIISTSTSTSTDSTDNTASSTDTTSSLIDTLVDTVQNIVDIFANATTTLEATTTDVVATTTDEVSTTTPEITQTETETDTGKLVTVSAINEDPDHPLTDVLASTTIPKIYKVGQEDKIHIKWKNNGDQNVTFHASDTDNDGYLDYVEWTVPHLSEQTFEIIFISKAFQLDSDQSILADIYDQVQAQDGNYASIPDGNYVRVTFNSILNNANDITVYAKPTDSDQPVTIEVYPVYTDTDGNQIDGPRLETVSDGANPNFSNIDHDGKYRILLKNLQTPTDVFDLKITGDVDIDYIVDPSIEYLSPIGDATVNLPIIFPSTPTTHYDKVDDPFPPGSPDDSTTYVKSGYSYSTDLYHIADHSIGTGTITGVRVYARMEEDASRQAYGKISINTENTTYDSATFSLTTAWTTYSNVWTNNPQTGLAWTWAEVDALQAGVSLMGNSGLSILKGQLILMDNGSQKKIEDVKVGDKIMSYNLGTKKTEKDKVTEVMQGSHDDYLVFNGTLKTSTNHVIWTNGEFIPAENITIGDLLLNSEGQLVEVTKIDHIYEKANTYDLEIEKNHNFFASGYLVHNVGKPPSSKAVVTQVYVGVSYVVTAPVTYYWVGATDGANTSVATNWSTTAGACGSGGANTNLPTSADDVHFGGTGNCQNGATVDSALSVNSFYIDSVYAGTVTQNASVTVAGLLTVSAGTLAVGTQTLAVTTNSTITGGTVTIGAGATGWTTDGMNIGAGGVVTCSGNSLIGVSSNWDSSGGTFTADTSTVTFNGTIPQSINTAHNFNNVTLNNNTFTLTSNITVGGNLVISEAKTPTITANSNQIFTVTGTTDGTTGGSAESLTVDTAGAVTFTGAVGSGASTMLTGLFITHSGALLFSSTINITGTLAQTYAATGTTTFTGAVNVGSAVLKGVAYAVNNSFTTTGSGAIAVTNSGVFTLSSAGAIVAPGGFVTSGAITLSNNITTNKSALLLGALTVGTGTTITLSTQQTAGAGNINISTINGAGTLILNSGTGTIGVTGIVGGTTPLTALTITNSAALTFSSAVTMTGAFTQTNPATGTTIFTGAVTVGSATLRGVDYSVNNTFTGAVAVTNSGVFTLSSAGAITAAGGFSTSGAVALSSNITTTNTALTIGGALTIGEAANVTLSTQDSAGTGNITLSGITTGTTGNSAETLTLNSGTGTISVAAIYGSGTSSDATGLTTVIITDSGDATFNNPINISGAFTQTNAATGITTFSSTLAAGSATFRGTTINLGGTTTISGNLTIGAGILDVTASNFALAVKGNWVNAGTFNARSGTVTFNGAAAQTITPGGSSFYNFISNKTGTGTNDDLTLAGDTSITNNLTLTDGEFKPVSYTVTLGGNLSAASASSGITYGTSTFIFDGVNKTISGTKSSLDFYNISINASKSVTDNITTNVYGPAFTANGTFIVGDGKIICFSNADQTLTIGDGGLLQGVDLTDSIFQFSSDSTPTITLTGTGNFGSSLYLKFSIGALSTYILPSLNYKAGKVDIFANSGMGNQTFTVTPAAGTLDIDGNFSLTHTGSDSGGDKLYFNNSNNTNINIGGNFTRLEDYNGGITKYIKGTSDTVTFDGAGTQTFDPGSLSTFNNITHSSAGTLQLVTTDLHADGAFLNSTGTFDANNRDMTFSGNWTNNGGIFTSGTGTVTFNGTSAESTITSGNSSFNNLTQNGVGGTYTLQDTTIVSGTLTSATGTLAIAGQTVTAGTVALTGGTISGTSGVLTGSSYDMQSGTVSAILGGTGIALTKTTSGTVALSGANTFTGGTTLSAGQLNINSATAIGTGALTITSGTIDNTSGGDITLSSNNTQSWNGNFAFGGTNNLNLGTGDVTLGANSTVTTNGTATLTEGGVISGAHSLVKAGTGTLSLNGVYTFSGGMTLNAGILSGNGSSSLGDTTINAGGSVSANSFSFVGDLINNGTLNSGNPVAGKTTNTSVINPGAGTFTFNASSTNTGTVNGNAILNASSTNYSGTSLGTITGTARFNTLTAVSGVVTFSSTTAFGGTGYVTGNLYDSTNAQITSWIFNASSTNAGYTKGNAIFNNTSSNAVTGTVTGNVTFNNTATNLGTVGGNADVYSPVTRPLGGTVNGQTIYHGYPGLYFNDTATGHGVTGKWDDPLNWWTDAAFTIHAGIVPTEGDDVTIYGDITASAITATAKTVTFESTSTNAISLWTNTATFNSSSTNTGTIHGAATFTGADTNNVSSGSVTGYITREYNAGIYVVTGDIIHNATVFTVQALSGASVNLASATYSLVDNIFQALNNGIFSAWNALIGSGASGNPILSITSPTNGENIKWTPTVSWGTTYLCQYKIDGGNYTGVTCANNGSDIPRPSAAAHTIFFKSTSAHGDIAEKSVDFTYDNTQAVDTDCTSALDEPTRLYYYLNSDVGNCTITASTTLMGNDGSGPVHSAGNLTGASGVNITLQNITATGTISAFNNMNVISSTLSGAITVNGILTGDTLSRFGANGTTTVVSGGTIASGVFVGNVVNDSGGTITSSSTSPFTTVAGNTTNNGTINGDFVFNGSSTNGGTINGNLTFGTLTATSGAVSFSGTTAFSGTGNVTGSIKDSLGATITRWIFNDSSTNAGLIKGNSFFNNTSGNTGTVSGNAYFSGSSTNTGTVTGTADIFYNVTVPLGGTTGTKTYHSYPNATSFNDYATGHGVVGNWLDQLNWFTDTTFAIPLGRMPTEDEAIVLFASTTLPADVTNNIFIASDDVTLDGGGVDGVGMHTLTGNVTGNGTYGGGVHSAFNFNLANIIVTGTTTANGTEGIGDTDGSNGGDINIATSSTWVISSNGGDPEHNGGDAGAITITNSYAITANTPILAKGGDSVGCGWGGSGGSVVLINSSYYATSTSNIGKGADSFTTCVTPNTPSHGSQGQIGVVTQTGVYTPPSHSTPTPTQTPSSSSSSYNPAFVFGNSNNPLSIPVANVRPLNLIKLPVFGGTSKNSFSFESAISNFLFSPLSTIAKSLKNTIQLNKYFASVGLSTQQDLFLIKNKPLLLAIPNKNADIPDGLLMLSSNDVPIPIFATYDTKLLLVEKATVTASTPLTVSFYPTVKGTMTASFNGNKYTFKKLGKTSLLSINFTAPSATSTYTLTATGAPLPLVITVVPIPKPIPTIEKVKKQSVWSVLKFW